MMGYNARGIRFGESYFDDGAETKEIDVLLHYQCSRAHHINRWGYFYTLVSDLRLSQEELLGKAAKNCAYEIRRARDKDLVMGQVMNALEPESLAEFITFYDQFAASKGLANVSRPKLERLRDSGMLSITRGHVADQAPLVYHAYISHTGQKRARLLYSASHYRDQRDTNLRNMVGRANRYLHFFDMLAFKQLGFEVYDWGGWYSGAEDLDRKRINEFKESFGGQLEQRYDSEQALTLKGRLFLMLKEIRLQLLQTDLRKERQFRQQTVEQLQASATKSPESSENLSKP